MRPEHDYFIDADEMRIAWVPVFRRFEEAICQLEPLYPAAAKRLRERFYADAAKPLAKPSLGEGWCEEAEAELAMAFPLSWEEAEEIANEYGDRSPIQVMDEHRLWHLTAKD